MALAIPKAMLHDRAFHAFTDGLREGHEDELMRWEAEVRAWEQDHDQPCPYDYPEDNAPTMEEVRLRIAEEEHARAEKGDSRTNKPASFILAGLEIEEEAAADLQRKRTLLLGMVKCLRDEQAHFMPGLAALLGTEPPVESSRRPEEMQLHLPSSFAKEVRECICVADLPARGRAAAGRASARGPARSLPAPTHSHAGASIQAQAYCWAGSVHKKPGAPKRVSRSGLRGQRHGMGQHAKLWCSYADRGDWEAVLQ
ncbi:hypothetical protein B0H14DRAFT_2642870, partial [Mycena olivaceomarginata]